MARRKRITFAFSEGWLANKDGKQLKDNPHTEDNNRADWEDGWIGRQLYIRELNKYKP